MMRSFLWHKPRLVRAFPALQKRKAYSTHAEHALPINLERDAEQEVRPLDESFALSFGTARLVCETQAAEPVELKAGMAQSVARIARLKPDAKSRAKSLCAWDAGIGDDVKGVGKLHGESSLSRRAFPALQKRKAYHTHVRHALRGN
jgi:hypothetical protein